MLGSVALGGLIEMNRKILENQEKFPYSFDDAKAMVLPANHPLVRRSASVAKVCKGKQLKDKPIYCKEYADPGCP